MRFLSSSAFAIAPKLMFAASCSAAEAMSCPRYLVTVRGYANGGLASVRGPPRLMSDVGRRSRLRNRAIQHLYRPAGSLDGLDGRLRCARHLEGKARFEFASAEDFYAVAR